MEQRRRKKRAVDKKRFFTVMFVFTLCVYVVFIFCMQQADINRNLKSIADVDSEIFAEQVKGEELEKQKSLIGTTEYKERVARERAGLVRSDEIIFIDPLEK